MKTDDRHLEDLDAFERRLRAGLDNIAAATPLQVHDEFDPSVSPLVWPEQGSRRRVPAVAAAAVITVGVAGVTLYGLRDNTTGSANESPVAAHQSTVAPPLTHSVAVEALLGAAVAATSAALADSGRVTVDGTTTTSDGSTVVETRSLLFNGDDWEITIGNAVNRYVGGAMFVQLVDNAGVATWTQDPDDAGGRQVSAVTTDPATLFRVLDPVADFSVAGDETVAGETVTYLVAAAPTNVAGNALGASGMIGGIDDGSTTTLSAIHVWIDANDLIRQIRVTGSWTWDAVDLDGQAMTWSESFDATMAFADYGSPFDIETPTDVQIADSNG